MYRKISFAIAVLAAMTFSPVAFAGHGHGHGHGHDWDDDDWDDNGRYGPRYGWCFSEQEGRHPCDPPPRWGWCYSEQSGKHPCDPPHHRRYDY